MTYEQIIDQLREHYDRTAAARDQPGNARWKLENRQRFLELLKCEGMRRLLEIGAGPGHDSLFFQQNGLNVVSTDLAPAMVGRCRAKGLTAHVMDFLHLDFTADSFDAVYALNCLLHVPRADMDAALVSIKRVLRPGGLLCVGTYGGEDREGMFVEGGYEEERFLSYYSSGEMLRVFSAHFGCVSLTEIPIVEGARRCAQSLVVRKL